MSLPASRALTYILVTVAISLVACSSGDITPEPTPSKTRPPTFTAVPPTPAVTETPVITAPLAVGIVSPNTSGSAGGALISKPVPKDPLLPIFSPFPPKPIPNRPPNLNPLTGLPGNPASLQRRPLLVRIGNDEKV